MEQILHRLSPVILFLLSIGLQISAAVFALLLVRTTGRKLAWIFFSLAMVLMAWRRIVSFVSLLTAGKTITFEFQEYIALIISVLMLMGVVRIGAYFRSIRIAEEKRKQAEDTLLESEEIFQSFIEHSPIYVFFKDENIRSLRLSRNYETMLNRPLTELLGKSMDELFPSALAKSMVEDDKRIMSEGKTLNIEEELNGRFYQTIKFPININGKPRYLAGFTIDITEHKKAEDALQKSEEFINNILESVDEGFVVIDPEFRIISANKAYCEQVKSPHCDIDGRHCYEVSHHRDRPCFYEGEECAPSHTFKTGMPYLTIHTHYDKEGNSVYIEAKSFPIKDASGNVTAVIETLNNITEKRRLEEQLRHVQKMEAIGTLAGGIAHDFNNMLNIIIGYGALMQMRMKEDDPFLPELKEILSAGDKASQITKGLLLFSRKQIMENNKPVNINELIDGFKKMLERIIGEDIELRISMADEALTVMADRGHIEQVLMNLAANAKDAMHKGGMLSIETKAVRIDSRFTKAHGYGEPGEYARISVTDTGTGMDEMIRERIFEPYFTTKGIGRGTGLGLSIVFGIVKQHKGYIHCYSELGKGTTFKIYLPFIKLADIEIEKTKAVAPKGGTEIVLLAEDDPAVRSLTKKMLESFGYTVIEAVNGEDAVSKFKENKDKIQLLLFDLIMPRKSGKEAYEDIKGIRRDIKAVFMSGYSSDIVNSKRLIEDGMEFISKPVLPNDLLRKVREALDKAY